MASAAARRVPGKYTYLIVGLIGLVAVALVLSRLVIDGKTTGSVGDGAAGGAVSVSVDLEAREVVVFTPIELRVQVARVGDNPYLEMPGDAESRAPVWAELRGPGDAEMAIDGFWDGDRTWSVRFSPTAAGVWQYTIRSGSADLDGQTGSFTAVAASPDRFEENPLLGGFLEVDDSGYGWRLSGGARFVPVGDTQWSWTEEYTLEELRDWVDAVAARGMNTILGCVWLGIYCCGFDNDRPEVVNDTPFEEGDPGTDRLVLDFFRKLDTIIEYANERGVMVGLTIGGFPGNSKWYEKFDTSERNDRWFRYVVARYAAYNVRWGLYGEVNEASTPWGRSWQEQTIHAAGLIRENDPYDHPIGSHHTRIDVATAENPYIDYIEAQVERGPTQYREAIRARRFGKPVWFEEYWYESLGYDDDVTRGIQNTYRNFVAGMAFPTMGSLVRAHHTHGDFPPHRARESGTSMERWLLAHDEGLRRMSFFAEFARDLDTSDFEEWSSRCAPGQCGRFGRDFAILLEGGGSVSIDLTGVPGQYTVLRLDVHSGDAINLKQVAGGGRRRIDSEAATDVSLLLRAVAE